MVVTGRRVVGVRGPFRVVVLAPPLEAVGTRVLGPRVHPGLGEGPAADEEGGGNGPIFETTNTLDKDVDNH